MRIGGLFESPIDIRTEYAGLRYVSNTTRANKRYEDTHGCSSANQLALAAQPLALRYKRNSVALLVHGEIAAVTENDGVCVFTIAIVTDSTLRVLFLTIPHRFTVNRSRRARTWSMGLGRFRIWLGNSLDASESAQIHHT